MHDTHAHLELLCQKLGYLPESISQWTSVSELQRDSIWSALIKTDNDQTGVFEYDISNIHNLLSDHDWIIHPTVSTVNLAVAVKLFQTIPKVYFLLGSHPEIVNQDFNLNNYLREQTEFLTGLRHQDHTPNLLPGFNLERLVGIGECGLDYYYTQDLAVKQLQQQLFEANIQLAIDSGLPLIVHTRDAWADTWSILSSYPAIHGKFLIHCFTGDQDELSHGLELGGKIALGGIITFPKSLDIQNAARRCPEDAFVLETDLPFLAPAPHRGKVCLPAMIQATAEYMAALKNASVEDIWMHSDTNSRELFQLKFNP